MNFAPGNEQCETELIKQIRQGACKLILPDTLSDLQNMINTMSVKKPNIPGMLVNSFLQLRLILLEEHKKGNCTIT